VQRAFETARALGCVVGTASDNTSFWFDAQDAVMGLTEVAEPDLVLLSFREGVSKRRSDGLYARLAARVEPSQTIVVDDREPNLARARELGFRSVRYTLHGNDELSDLVAASIRTS
jgi:hypothetical protein